MTIYSLLALCLVVQTSAQNLVPNGDFETFRYCPQGLGSVKHQVLAEWYANPRDCTPDYFNACNNKDFGVPQNLCGTMPAYSGTGYVGIIVRIGESSFDIRHPYHLRDLLYREHLAVKLTQPLKARFTYIFRMYVALAQYSNYAAGNLGVMLAHLPLEVAEDVAYSPQILFKEALKQHSQWVCLQDTFVAQGGEQYLIIGNFDKYKDRKLTFLGENKKHKGKFNYNRAYYYIDDVFLKELAPASPPLTIDNTIETPWGRLKKGDKLILNNILFDFDEAVLLPPSFAELDKLAQLLYDYPRLQVFILGHTDSIGTEQKNLLLSEQRASSVAEYLQKKGIEKQRIKSKGLGESQPVDSNQTPEGRNRNRRVEAILKE